MAAAPESEAVGAGAAADAVQKQNGKENEAERRRRRRKQKKKGKQAANDVGGEKEVSVKVEEGDRSLEEVRVSLSIRPDTLDFLNVFFLVFFFGFFFGVLLGFFRGFLGFSSVCRTPISRKSMT